jgi:hypothetical protein
MGKENRREAPPDNGLSVLTRSEVEQIDHHVKDICAVGYGTVEIVIERGLPRFIRLKKSVELKPAGV